MHESGTVRKLLRTLEEEMKKAGGKRVRSAILKIGVLSGVDADHLKSDFDALKKGTFAEGADIAIEKVQAKGECLACGNTFVPDEIFLKCNKCGSYRCNIISGNELLWNKIEVE